MAVGPGGSIVVEIIGDAAPITATLNSLQSKSRPITVQLSLQGTQAALSEVARLTAGVATLTAELRAVGTVSATAFNQIRGAVGSTNVNLATMNTELNNAVAVIGRMTAAWQANGAAARAAQAVPNANARALIGQAGGIGGASGLNNAALGLSFISPTAGLAAMAVSLGPVVAGLVAAGLAAKTLGDGIEKAATFQRSLQQIKGISGIDTKSMNEFGQYVQKLSTDLPLTTQQLTELGRQAVLVGLHGSEGIKTYTENMAALSIVLRDVDGHSQGVEETGQEVVKVLRSMGATTSEVNAQFAGSINSLVALKTEFGVQVPQVTALAKFWSSYGHEIGLTTDQVFGWSAALVSVGARAQGAGGALQKFFQILSKDASQGADGMKEWAKVMNISTEQAYALVRSDPSAFLKQFVAALPSFMKDGKDSAAVLAEFGLKSQQVTRAFAELATSLPNADRALMTAKNGMQDVGLAMRTAKEAADNFKDRTVELGNAWDAFKTNVGAQVIPMLTSLMNSITPVAQAIFKLSQDLQGLKSPEEIQAKLKITASDDFTTATLKLLTGGMQGLTGTTAGKLATGSMSTDILKMGLGVLPQLSRASDLQGQLQDRGLIQTPSTPGGAYSQLVEILGNMAKYQKQLVDYQAKGGANLSMPNTPGQLTGMGSANPGPALSAINATVAAASFSNTGNQLADSVAGWCARWVKLTLEKAEPNAAAQIEKWFSGDADTVKKRLSSSGKLQPYSGNPNDLKPGDVVVYDQNHIGIYIGNGLVRGNNEWGAKNGRPVVSNEGINSLGSIAGIVRAADAASGFSGAKPTGGSALPTGPSLDDLERRLKTVQGRMTVAGEGASKYAGSLKELQAAALQLAHTQEEGSDDWNKAIQVYGSATSALKGFEKGTKEYVATRKDFNTYGQQALDLIKKQEQAQQSGSAREMEAARGAIVAFQARGQAAKAVFAAENDAHTQLLSRQATADAESKRVNQALAQGRVADAQTALERLKTIQAQELQNAGDSQAARLNVVKRTSQQIYEAEMALARVTRRDALAAANLEKDPALRAAEVSRANSAYALSDQKAQLERIQAVSAAQKSATSEADAATKLAHDKREASNKAIAALQAKLNEELRQGTIQKAQDTLTALGQLRERDLADVKTNVVEKLSLTKRYAQLEYDATVRVAEATRQAAIRAAQNAHTRDGDRLDDRAQQVAIDAANRAYGNTVRGADNTRSAAITGATEAQTSAIQKQKDAYHALAETLRAHVQAGDLDSATQQELTRQFNQLGRETATLGLTTDKGVIKSRALTYALIEQGQAAYTIAQRMQGMVSGNTEAAETALDLANGLTSLGQRGAAIDLLTTTLSNLMDSAARGEATAESVDKLRAALDGLTSDQNTELQAQDFLAGLDGSIDEQLSAIQAKLEDPATGNALRRAILEMTQGFGTDSAITGSMGDAGRDAVTAWVDGAEERARQEKDRIARIQQAIDFALVDPERARGAGSPGDAVGMFNRGLGNTMPGATGNASALPTRPKPKLNPDGTPYVDGGVDARPDWASRDAAYETFQASEAQDAYTKSLGKMNLEQLHAEEANMRRVKSVERLKLVLAAIAEQEKSVYVGSGPVLPEKEKAWMDNQASRQIQIQASAFADLSDEVLAADLATAKLSHNTEDYNAILAEQERRLQKTGGQLDAFASGLQALGSAFSSMGGGADLFGKSLSAIGTGVQVFKQAQTAVTDTKKAFGPGGSLLDMLGAAGEWGQIASTVINVIGGIGDAIMNLSPAFQAWKKGLLEVADAEKQAMGSKSYGGNSILNPYYEALKKDSEALTSKANAGFWQRVGWALFGGAPETLDKAQSDALTKAGTIFNDFAGSLYGAMESALMNAFDSGNFDGVAAAVEKSLNQLVAKMYLQTLIAKSKIGDDLKMLADDQSAGKDITADLARLKADVNGVTQQYEAGSAALPGFGAGAADGSSGSSGTMFGQGAQAVEFSLPSVVYEGFTGFDSSVTLFSSTINAADAMYRRVEAMYTRVETAFDRGFGIDINLAQGTQSLQASIPTGPLR